MYISFLPLVVESQGLAGQTVLEHFDKMTVRWADEIEAQVAPLKIYRKNLSDAAV